MKFPLLLLVCLALLMAQCGSKNEDPDADKLKQEITRLKKALSKKNNLYLDLDGTMREADKNLSSIRTQKAEIDSILQLPGALNNKKLLLEKVEAMKAYAAESRKSIEKLEKQLAKAKGQNVVGLKRIIRQLRADLDEKEVTIADLKGQVQNLARNLAVMQTNLKKERQAKEKAQQGLSIAQKDRAKILSEKEKKERAFEKYKNNPIVRNVDVFADRNPDRTRSISRRSVKQLTVKFNVPINRYLEKGKRYSLYIDLILPNGKIFRPARLRSANGNTYRHTAKADFTYNEMENQPVEISFDVSRKGLRRNIQRGIHRVQFFLDGAPLNGRKIIKGKNATISFGN